VTDWDRGAQPVCNGSFARLLPGGSGFCGNEYVCEKEGCLKDRELIEKKRKTRRQRKPATPKSRDAAIQQQTKEGTP